MANPFEHESGDDEAATQRLAEHLEQGVRDGEDNREPEDFELSPKKEAPEEEGEERETREDKKRNRYKEQSERADAAEARAQRLEAELAAQRVHQQNQPAREPGPDPLQEEIDSTQREHKDLQRSYEAQRQAGTLTEAEAERMNDRGQELMDRRTRLVAQQGVRQAEAARPASDQTMEQIRMRHPDVAANANAINYADGLARMRRARGEEFSFDLVDEVMEETRKEFKMGRHRHGVVDDRDRARYAAPVAGSGSSANSRSAPAKITMTPERKRMAAQMYPHIKDDRKRNQKWATEVGPRFLELERDEGRRV